MTSNKLIDNTLLSLGIVFVSIGIWFFKDFAIARHEATRGLHVGYECDIIIGTIFVLLGAGFAVLVGNNNFKRFFNKRM